MKKTHNFKILFTITALLLILSVSISLINYAVSLNARQSDLINRSLPLSVDNIYTEIQSHIIEPTLVSSMMASDTFVRDWLLNDEQNSEKIARYLEVIKNKYSLFVTFLVSDKTQSYYTHDGLLEHVSLDNPNNAWYFKFKQIAEDHEINLDYNANLDNSMMMFINYKIFDSQYHLIGVTGIGHKISYIDDMLLRFREQFKFTVYFLDEAGNVVLAQRQQKAFKNLSDDFELSALKDQILSKYSKILHYERMGEGYLINTKYIPELRLHLVVEAKISDFTDDVNKTFYFNLGASLLVTVVITLMILLTIRKYNKKLEYLAHNDGLTALMNRHTFNETLHKHHLLFKRHHEALSLLFFDVDDFKNINDTMGHHVGDEVLIRIAELLKSNLRQTDIIARWGGEEFIVGLINTEIKDAEVIAEKLRSAFEYDVKLQQYSKEPITASFGVTQCDIDEPLETALARLDDAMYASKKHGKNRVSRL
jgi:diguanylate cyclase (GGDEF)-like protein